MTKFQKNGKNYRRRLNLGTNNDHASDTTILELEVAISFLFQNNGP